jgi:uncharacterized protein
MIGRVIIAAALVASVPSLASAQTAPAASPNAVALAKARELMVAMHTEDLTRRTVDAQMKAMTGGLANQLLASGQVPPAMVQDPEFRAIMQRYLDVVTAKVTGTMNTSMPQIMEIMTRVYATNFTPAEMDDMLVFYRSKTGQSVLSKLPDVTSQTTVATRDLTMGPAMKAAQDALPTFLSELKAWADKHPEAAGTKQ